MKRKRKHPPTDLSRPAREWRWPRIGLFMPHGETVPGACVPHHMAFTAFHGLTPIDMGRSLQLDMTRTRACETFLRSDLTHLLMLDADHRHPLDLPAKLARWCIATRGTTEEVEVIGGLNFARTGEHVPCCFLDRDGEEWDGDDLAGGLMRPVKWGSEPFRVAVAGTGSLLIARTALEKVSRPFFRMPVETYDPTAEIAWPGEDVGFAGNCRRAGVSQWIDPTCTSPHYASRFVGADDYRP